MVILGINAYHGDSSACLVKDGALVAAAEEERIELFIKQLYIRAEVVELGPISVEVPRDPGDAPILATLATAKADVLVTGDGDLLALSDKYPIETPAEFVRRL